MLADSWLPPTPYLRRRSTSSGSWSETSAGSGFGGPRSRPGAHHVENIARRLVPLTPASCKGDGGDWLEMSRDVRQRRGGPSAGGDNRWASRKKGYSPRRGTIGRFEARARSLSAPPA